MKMILIATLLICCHFHSIAQPSVIKLDLKYDGDFRQKIYCTIQNNVAGIKSLRLILDYRSEEEKKGNTAANKYTPCVYIKVVKVLFQPGEIKTLVLAGIDKTNCQGSPHVVVWDYVTKSGENKICVAKLTDFFNYLDLFK
jgi:hypothetical protein